MEDESIYSEVQELRHELGQLRSVLSKSIESPKEEVVIRLRVERTSGERKPFLFLTSHPNSQKLALSTTRAALVLTLLQDLARRSQGRSAIVNLKSSTAAVATILSSKKVEEAAALEQVRLGFYRLTQSWNSECETMFGSSFDAREGRLVGRRPGVPYVLEISSSDSEIDDALAFLGTSPILSKVLREQFYLVPDNREEGERFLREIYASPGNLSVTSTYVRPQLISLPPHLAEKYAATFDSLERYRRMHLRMKAGTLQYTEILNLEDLKAITMGEAGSSHSYSSNLSPNEMWEHLQHIRKLLSAKVGYRLILTQRAIPFYVAVYTSDDFSLSGFFRIPSARTDSNFGTFFASNDKIASNFNSNIFDWLSTHHTTISLESDVCEVLQSLSARLRA